MIVETFVIIYLGKKLIIVELASMRLATCVRVQVYEDVFKMSLSSLGDLHVYPLLYTQDHCEDWLATASKPTTTNN